MTYNMDKSIAKTILALGLGFSLLSLPTMASAAVFFSQGFDPSNFAANGTSDFGSSTQRADDFSITQDNILGSVSWQGIYLINGATTDNFTLRLFTDSLTSTPNQTPFWSENVANLSTRTVANNPNLFTYEANLSAGMSLTAGTTYWLSIVNNTTNDWSWAASSTGGLAANRSLDSNPWTQGNGTFQFQLATAVPAPGAIWFLGSGLLGLLFSKRNQKRFA